MRQSIKFVQKSIDPKPSIVDMIKVDTVLKKGGLTNLAHKVRPMRLTFGVEASAVRSLCRSTY